MLLESSTHQAGAAGHVTRHVSVLSCCGRCLATGSLVFSNHHTKQRSLSSCFSCAAGSGSQDFEEVAGGICLQVYRETLKGVVTACRRYKDELLEACLQLVLSAPTAVMTIHVRLKSLSPIF